MLFVFLFLAVFFSTLLNSQWDDKLYVVATFENYLQPVIITIIFSLLIKNSTYDDIQKKYYLICKLIIFFLCLNSIFIISSNYFDLSFIDKLYEIKFKKEFLIISDDILSQSVKARSINMGRYLGVFNQPMSSGCAYLVGTLCFLTTYRRGTDNTFLSLIIIGLLTIGGSFSVSKVFLFGLPLIILTFFILSICINKLSKSNIYILIIILSVLPILVIFLDYFNWRGYDFFVRFFEIDNYFGSTKLDNVIIATAEGRFTNDTYALLKIKELLMKNKILGYGVTDMHVFDSGIYEITLLGGLLGIAIYLSIIFYFLVISLLEIAKRNPMGISLFCIFIIFFGTSLGGSPIHLNRVSPLLLLVILSTICLIKFPKKN